MTDILEEIVAHKRIELSDFQREMPLRKLSAVVEHELDEVESVSMKKALLESESGIIAEFKRKSPSKGWIKEEGRADVIPFSYQQNGAAALSILTDTAYFGGSDEFIRTARQSGVTLPILYKNFVVDDYQLFQARHCGASAVLLIASVLPKDACRRLLSLAHDLKMEALLEIHDEQELDYVDLTPDMIGVNNRHLGTFHTDVQSSFSLAQRLPSDLCKVSESGISHPETVKSLRLAGFNGFLIGENFMKTPDPGTALAEFIKDLKL